jgi:hypothetical protein
MPTHLHLSINGPLNARNQCHATFRALYPGAQSAFICARVSFFEVVGATWNMNRGMGRGSTDVL